MNVFAEVLSGGQLIIVGALLVGAALVLRRSASGARRASIRDPLREVREEFQHAESSYAAQLSKLEIRLLDFTREVEGRMQTRLTVLDQLVVEADREINRLEDLLAETRGISTVRTPILRSGPDLLISGPAPIVSAPDVKPARTAESEPVAPGAQGHAEARRAIYSLYDSGFSPHEIAGITGQSPANVALLLKLRTAPPGQASAA